MRVWLGITACFVILLTEGAAWAQAEQTSPHVLVFPEQDGAPAPAILRGSAAEREPRPDATSRDLERYALAAGSRLWLVDLDSGELRSCINRDTSTVGVRVIRCTSGELGPYYRTFGRRFSP